MTTTFGDFSLPNTFQTQVPQVLGEVIIIAQDSKLRSTPTYATIYVQQTGQRLFPVVKKLPACRTSNQKKPF